MPLRLVKDKFICFFCQKETTRENYCYGCDEAVCEECDYSIPTTKKHNVQAHQEGM